MFPRKSSVISWIGLPVFVAAIFGALLPRPSFSTGGYGMPTISAPVPVTPGTNMINQSLNMRTPGGKKKKKRSQDKDGGGRSSAATPLAMQRHEYMSDMVGNLNTVGNFARRSLRDPARGLSAQAISDAESEIRQFMSAQSAALDDLQDCGREKDTKRIDSCIATARARSKRAYEELDGPAKEVVQEVIRDDYFDAMADLSSDQKAASSGLGSSEGTDEPLTGKAKEMKMALSSLKVVASHAAKQGSGSSDLKKFVGGVTDTLAAIDGAAATDNFSKVSATVESAGEKTADSLSALQSGPAGDVLSDYIGPKYGEMISDI